MKLRTGEQAKVEDCMLKDESGKLQGRASLGRGQVGQAASNGKPENASVLIWYLSKRGNSACEGPAST